MKLKKFIAIMAVTAMVAGMATGCGESKSDAGSDSTGSDTKTESLKRNNYSSWFFSIKTAGR